MAKISQNTPVIIPIAAIEQHGHHLPLAVDSMLLGEVVRRANETLGEAALFLPLQWLGNSHHHLDFAGTLSADPRVYLDLLNSLAENVLHHGFRRILFLNGHGGNIVPSSQAVFELRQRHRTRTDLLLLAATYWTLGAEPHRSAAGIEQNRMGHACEWETSMMLRLAPHLVHQHTETPPTPIDFPYAPAVRGWVTQDRNPYGHIGDPRGATAEKGETLFELFAADVTQLVRRMIDWNGSTWS